MDGGATFYLALAAMTAGTVISTTDTIRANKERAAQLESELRDNELAALDEENRRLLALREANDDLLVNAGGIDAYASPSLIAARSFNFKIGMQDIENTQYNLLAARAATSVAIGILKRNSRATLQAGIFEVAGNIFAGFDAKSSLSKTSMANAAEASKITKPPKSILGPKT